MFNNAIPNFSCPARLQLSNDMAVAVPRSYGTKADFDQSVKEKKETGFLSSALANAGLAEKNRCCRP